MRPHCHGDSVPEGRHAQALEAPLALGRFADRRQPSRDPVKTFGHPALQSATIAIPDRRSDRRPIHRRRAVRGFAHRLDRRAGGVDRPIRFEVDPARRSRPRPAGRPSELARGTISQRRETPDVARRPVAGTRNSRRRHGSDSTSLCGLGPGRLEVGRHGLPEAARSAISISSMDIASTAYASMNALPGRHRRGRPARWRRRVDRARTPRGGPTVARRRGRPRPRPRTPARRRPARS